MLPRDFSFFPKTRTFTKAAIRGSEHWLEARLTMEAQEESQSSAHYKSGEHKLGNFT